MQSVYDLGDDARLGVEGDGALVNILPVVALSRLHVDHLPKNNPDYFLYEHSLVSKSKAQIFLFLVYFLSFWCKIWNLKVLLVKVKGKR